MSDEEFLAEVVATGGFAYPCIHPMPSGGTYSDGGITKRDWFAGLALIAIADDCGMTDAEIAERCYQRADAMLAARKP